MKVHFTRAQLAQEHNKYDSSALEGQFQADRFPVLPLKHLLWCSDLPEEVLLRKDRFATREPGFPGVTRWFEWDGMDVSSIEPFINHRFERVE